MKKTSIQDKSLIYNQDKNSLSKTNCFFCNSNFRRPDWKYKGLKSKDSRFYKPWDTDIFCCISCVGDINQILYNDDDDCMQCDREEAFKIHQKNIKSLSLIEINNIYNESYTDTLDIDYFFGIIDKIENPISSEIKNPANDIIKEPVMRTFDDTDSKFRLHSGSIFLTYKHHIPFIKLVSFIENTYPILEYVICHEDGDKNNPYLHTHITIRFKNIINVKNCRAFDYKHDEEVIHPNIKTTRDWVASCEYLLKQSRKTNIKNWDSNFDVETLLKATRNKYVKKLKRDLKEEPKPGDIEEQCIRIGNYKNSFEAIQKEASSLKDVMAINMIYNNKIASVSEKQINYLKNFELRRWQKKLYEILDNEQHRRKVYWIVDKRGGQGKSDFCSYVDTLMKPEKCLTIASTGSIRDISDVIRNWMDKGSEPEIILIDLPRTFQDRESIYTLIESIKNGRLTCTKYKGTTLKFFPPHVMIFSNWMPETKLLSADRWAIMDLLSKKANDSKAKLVDIDIDELNERNNMDNYDN